MPLEAPLHSLLASWPLMGPAWPDSAQGNVEATVETEVKPAAAGRLQRQFLLPACALSLLPEPLSPGRPDISRESHPETAPPGDPSHIQQPNTDTIANAKKGLLTGT